MTTLNQLDFIPIRDFITEVDRLPNYDRFQ